MVKHNFKKFTSLLLALAMTFSLMPTILADDAASDDRLTDGHTPSTVYLDLMQFKDGFSSTNQMNQTDSMYATPVDIATFDKDTSITAGQEFVLGIRLSDLANIKAATAGLNSMSVHFTYDKEYIECLDTNLATLNMMARMGTANGNDSIFNMMGSMYGGIYTPHYNLNTDATTIDTSKGEIQWAISTSSASASQQSYTGDKDVYIGLLAFKYLKNGTEIPSGTKLFTPVSGNTKGFNMGFGGGEPTYEANNASAAINITPLVMYDISNVNVAPATYTVDFYNGTADGQLGDKLADDKSLTIGENFSAKDTNQSLPTENDLTAPDGMVFKEFRYDDPNEADVSKKSKPFDEETKLVYTMFADGDSTLKVYAVYENGHTVTFNSNTQSITGAANTEKKVTVKKTNPSAINISKKPTIGKSSDTPAPDFVAPAGKSFKEWNTQADGQGTPLVFEEDGVTGTPVYTTDGASTNIDTVYAIWEDELSITYDANNGTNDASVTNPVVKKASEVYVDPVNPTRTSANGTYKFVGWNTKKNGSGSMIKANGTATYGDLLSAVAGAPNIILYAQWAAVTDPDPVASDAPTDPDPDNKGVKVTFDSNARGNLTSEEVKEPKLKYYYPVYGDSLDTLPEEPTRTNYKFKEWNTKPDGLGTKITASTKFDTDTLGADLKEVAGTTTSYEITVYAIWDLDKDNVAPENQITITFNANKDGKGASGDDYKEIEIFKGDAIGYDITAPDNAPLEFMGWFTGNNSTGTVVFDTEQYSPTTKMEGPKTYYAKWQQVLIVEPQPFDAPAAALTAADTTASSISTSYTGEVLKPKYNIYAAVKNEDGTDYVKATDAPINSTPTDFTEADSPYQATYVGSSSNELKNVDTYGISVTLKDGSDLKTSGARIAKTYPNTIEITPALLTVNVDPATQTQKAGAATKATITVDGVQTADSAKTVYETNYYLWSDAGEKDGNIQNSELGAAIDNPTATGLYVIKIENVDSNYKIDDVVSTDENTHVLFYDANKTAKYPGYPELFDDSNKLINVGQNIVYSIQPNDPSASDIAIKGVKPNPGGDPIETPADLKENDYDTDKPLAKYDETAPTHSDEYWTRVDKDTEEVKIEVTPEHPDGVTVTVKVGDTVIQPNPDGTYTVPIDDDHKGKTTTDISITLSAGTAPDQKEQEYVVHVQTPGKGKITLNYGNSPYGEIMKADNIAEADKDAAKAAFNTGNIYADPYIPTAVANKVKNTQSGSLNLSTNILWYPYRAWVDIADMSKATEQQLADLANPDINMDRNDYAIFVYNNKYFVDPGFTAVDSIGNPVENVTRKITVNKMTTGLKTDGIYDGNYKSKDITIENKPSNYLMTEVTMPYSEATPELAEETALVRPDVYEMYYSFTDPITGEEVTVTDEDGNEKPRYVVVLQSRGDTNFSLQVNLQDVNPVYQFFNKEATYFKTEGTDHVITGTARQVYLYRCLDIRASDQVNLQDVNPIYQFFNNYDKKSDEIKAENNNPLEEWYTDLSANLPASPEPETPTP